MKKLIDRLFKRKEQNRFLKNGKISIDLIYNNWNRTNSVIKRTGITYDKYKISHDGKSFTPISDEIAEYLIDLLSLYPDFTGYSFMSKQRMYASL